MSSQTQNQKPQKPQARFVETNGCFNAATTTIIRPANSNTFSGNGR